METRVVNLRGESHWSGSEILNLLQMEIKVFSHSRQLGHILLSTSGMRGDKIGYELLPHAMPPVNVIKNRLKLSEE